MKTVQKQKKYQIQTLLAINVLQICLHSAIEKASKRKQVKAMK